MVKGASDGSSVHARHRDIDGARCRCQRQGRGTNHEGHGCPHAGTSGQLCRLGREGVGRADSRELVNHDDVVNRIDRLFEPGGRVR